MHGNEIQFFGQNGAVVNPPRVVVRYGDGLRNGFLNLPDIVDD